MAESTFLVQNSILNSAIVAWSVAQFIKVFISLINGDFDISRLTGSGGMPSSHTSTVTALTTAVFFVSGYHSVEFAIALTVAAIVMYDATGVRRAAGEQAKKINYMMMHLNKTTPKEFSKELKELLGHTPLEVLAGAILGIIIGFIVVKL